MKVVMFVALGDWLAVGMLSGSMLRTIGLWAAGYVLLSLCLAVVWITLVTIGQNYQSSRALNPTCQTPIRALSMAFGFHRWLRGDDEFSRQLEHIEDSLSATGSGEREPRGSTTESGPPLRAGS